MADRNDLRINPGELDDIIDLTPMQQGILYHYLQAPGGYPYLGQLCIDIRGEIENKVFKVAWEMVIDANEMLRTVFRWDRLENPVQVVLKKKRVPLLIHDFSGKARAYKEEMIRRQIVQDRNRFFDLRRAPFIIILCKIRWNEYKMILLSHHILYDGWSSAVILREFFLVYGDLVTGAAHNVADGVKIGFKEYVKWLQALDVCRQKEFWRNYLEGFTGGIDLTLNREGREKCPGFERFPIRVADELGAEIKDFIVRHQLTLAALFYCTWGVLLQRYQFCRDVVFGITVSGRSANINGIGEAVGLFINTIPLRVLSSSGETVRECLTGLNRQLQVMLQYQHQFTPLADIKKCVEIDDRRELFDSLLVVENYPLDERLMLEQEPLSVDSYSMHETTHYDLTVLFRGSNVIEIEFVYALPVFSREMIGNLSGHFLNILRDVVDNPDGRIAEVDIMSAEERARILYEWGNLPQKYIPVSGQGNIPDMIESRVGRIPDRIAVVDHGNSPLSRPDNRQLSYEGLNRKLNALASVLIARGVRQGEVVAVMAERSLEMVCAILGVLTAGGMYLPIEPGYPEGRVRYMLLDGGVRFLLGQDPWPCTLPQEVIRLESGSGELLDQYDNKICRSSCLNISSGAYVLYTSGSTGRPKGVVVEHRSVVNILRALAQDYPFPGLPVYLYKTSFMFDVSVTELFGWIYEGGRVAILENRAQGDPAVILDAVERFNVTHLNFVPSMFQIFVHAVKDSSIAGISCLNYIFLAGEPLLSEHVKWFKQFIPGITLVNLYGPTEATIYASGYSLRRWGSKACIPIGNPLDDVQLFVVDHGNRLQPEGVAGELCISGAGVSRGYLNQPELTAERFENPSRFKDLPSPYSDRGSLYRTGDLARWLADGTLEFLGRIDRQVKIRGFRIELSEIENRLISYEEVEDAVVDIKIDADGKDYLCGYYTSPKELDETSLRRYLALELPEYMIPAFIMRLQKIPLTVNRKVDRRALPDPRLRKTNRYRMLPLHSLESKLMEIWAEILGVPEDRIGMRTHFFDLGGHSLNLVKVLMKIHKEFGINIPLGTVIDNPTIEGLVSCLKGAGHSMFPDIEPVEERSFYPVSFSQKRLWYIHQRNAQDSSYNITGRVELRHPVDPADLQAALANVSKRHESLRTRFGMVNGEPVLFIEKDSQVNFQKIDISTLSFRQKQERREKILTQLMKAVFDLYQAPLFQVVMVKVAAHRYDIIFSLHHIIADGWSLEILKSEFFLWYDLFKKNKKVESEPLKYRYRDYITWQKRRLAEPGLKEKAIDFWRRNLGSELPFLQLSPLRNRSEKNSEAAGYRLIAEERVKIKLKRVALEQMATLFTLMYSVLMVFISMLSNRQEVLGGFPAAGREHTALQQVVGLFLNIIVLKSRVDRQGIFIDFFKRTNDDIRHSLLYQDYPFELVLEKLNMPFPHLPVFFNMLNLQERLSTARFDTLDSGRLPVVQDAKFDICLYVSEYGNGIEMVWHYRKTLFAPDTVEYLAQEYLKLLIGVADSPTKKIGDYNIFNPCEIISRGNRVEVGTDFSGFPRSEIRNSLVYRFKSRVERYPHRLAVKTEAGHLSYLELDGISDRIAGQLYQDMGRGKGIAILFEHAEDMVKGMIGTLKSGNYYIPLDPAYPPRRLHYILEDSGAAILLTNDSNRHGAENLLSSVPMGRRLMNISRMDIEAATTSQELDISACESAYILYTSGSTGVPKGVLQNHRNVMHFISTYSNRLHINPDDRLSLFSSYSFDAAVMDIYGALLNGAALFPFDIKGQGEPHRLVRWLIDERVTIFHSIPTVFRFVVDVLSGRESFTHLRLLVLGGEAVVRKDMEAYYKYFDDSCILINGLGPTESTVTLQYFIDKNETIIGESVPVGFAVDQTEVLILDKNGKASRIFERGEIVYRSDYLALGYLNHPEKTSEVFVVDPLRGRMFLTGDLGIRLPDGSVEYAGRRDQQVKIKGYRVELGEIECLLERISGVKKGVVSCRKSPEGENYLVVYYVADGEVNVESMERILAGYLPDHMIPTTYVRLEKLPLTPSGKIDRRRLPEPSKYSSFSPRAYRLPRNYIEERLVEIWGKILGMDRISTDSNFFRVGGHSLRAILLIARISSIFGIEIYLQTIFENPTIRSLAEYIKIHTPEKCSLPPRVECAEKKEYYKLWAPQKRLFVLQQMDPRGTAHNISTVMALDGLLDADKLRECFTHLVGRQESLRTSFDLINGEPVQKIEDKVDFDIEYFEWGEKPDITSMVSRFVKPFDLSQAPLFRVELIKVGEFNHVLIVDIHHIIADGMSLAIMARDMMRFYNGDLPGEIKIHYKDFAEWQNRNEASGEIRNQEEYWLGEFASEVRVLNLPTDFRRPRLKSFSGDNIRFGLQGGEIEKLKELALREDATFFMVLLSIYFVFLARLSSQDDIVVGVPVSGRRYTDLENTVGMFVNTLALRHYPFDGKRFIDFFKEVRRKCLAAFGNQDYQLNDLVEKTGLHRDPGRNPLFDVMFTFQDLTMTEIEIPTLTCTPLEYDEEISKFDLNLVAREEDDGLKIIINYCRELFRREALMRFAGYFKNIIASVLTDPAVRVGEVEIMGAEERKDILEKFNNTEVRYPVDRTTGVMLEEQACRTPHRIAAVFKNIEMSYRELNEKANQLAHTLTALGIGRGSLVPVLIDHSLELLISFYSLLKIGAAFVPIDVAWPLKRIDAVLDDLVDDAALLNDDTSPEIKKLRPRSIMVNHLKLGRHPDSPINKNGPEDLIYLMFTSGSTGKPKGVMVAQRGITNRLYWMNDYFGAETSMVVLQTTRYVYDSVVWQFFWPLMNGGKTIILPPRQVLGADDLIRLVQKHDIRIVDFVPSVFSILVDQLLEETRLPEKLSSLKDIILGGEEIIPSAVYKFKSRLPGVRVTNLYGPTETTIGCIYHQVTGDEGKRIPIGRPISNVEVFVTNKRMRLSPKGIPGEMMIAGIGVGLGYLNEIEKTARVFVDNPFAPGRKMYRTGDLGRWSVKGHIDFLGRVDYQVKIRGVRLELKEIENELLTHDSIKEAAVLDRKNRQGEKYLCAYVVSDERLNKTLLRRYLLERLPEYMVPAYFISIPRLPLTSAGKIDRKGLPEPEIHSETLTYIPEQILNQTKISENRQPIDPDAYDISQLEQTPLTQAQRDLVVYSFNRTDIDLLKDRLVHWVYEEQAEKTPAASAVLFRDHCLTYSELNHRANQLARLMRSRGVTADTIVGVMAPRSLEIVAGILAIWKAGGAFMPLEPEYPRERRVRMIEDTCPILLLTKGHPGISDCNVGMIDLEGPENYCGHNADLKPANSAVHLSHVLFTSGTTGYPRAIMLEHRSLVNVMSFLLNLVPFSDLHRIASLTPITFDLFTADTIFPLCRGAVVVLGGEEILIDDQATSLFLEREKITIYRSNPSGLQRLASNPRLARGLYSLKYLLIAGEPLLKALLEKIKRITTATVYNLYGPAETTMYSTAGEVGAEHPLSIGKPVYNTRTYVLNTGSEVLPIGVEGELCIGGDGVARGYLNRPALTSEKFVASPFRENDRIYYSGDLARWRPDGCLEFIGRRDLQVKIGGIRMEPGEIESCLLSHKHIREAAVVVRKNKSLQPYLCAFLVLEKRVSELEIRTFLAEKLPHYMIPSIFAQVEAMPLTASKKINRVLLSSLDIESLVYRDLVAPENETEELLVDLWAEILGKNKECIGRDTNFFEVGGHSLNAAVLVSRIHKLFDIKIPLGEMFRNPTVRGLALYIAATSKEKYTSISPIEKREYYNLSPAQKRLWFLYKSDSRNPFFNMSGSVTFREHVDKILLSRVLEQLVSKYESLRTCFREVDGIGVQVILPTGPVYLPTADLANLNGDRLEEKKEKIYSGMMEEPFKLESGPLFRVKLIRYRQDQYDLLFTMHHIITDGWSMELLEREFRNLYQASSRARNNDLLPLKIQYKDYAEWHNQLLSEKNRLDEARAFWTRQLQGKIPVLNLPYSFEIESLENYRSAAYRTVFHGELIDLLRAIAAANRASLFMVLLAAFNVFLSRITGQRDILVGVPGAARQHEDLKNVIGFFVNTLIFRNQVNPEDSFCTLLRRVQENTVQVLEYQSYPLELICRELRIQYPRINVFFNMSIFGNRPQQQLSDLRSYHLKSVQNAKFDIVCYLTEYRNAVEIDTHYYRELFETMAIETMMSTFGKILKNVTEDRERAVGYYELSSTKRRILLN